MRSAASIVVLLCLEFMAATAQPICPQADRDLVTELGSRHRKGASFADAETSKRIPAQAIANTRYVRIRIDVTDAGTCDSWLLTVRDEKFRVVQTLSKSDFGVSGVRWTNRVRSAQALVELARCEFGRPLIRLDEYIIMPEKATSFYSSETATATWQDLYTSETGIRRFGDFVGMLMSSWDQVPWVCSGVIVAPTLFLTNWHCGGTRELRDKDMWNELVLKDALIDMSWDSDDISREFGIEGKVSDDPDLDFALLRIAPIEHRGTLRPVQIRRSRVTFQEPVRLVHHPLGERKQVSLTHCEVDEVKYQGWTGRQTTEFTHRCDSDGGSSGAPVLDVDGQLVGLHHLGYAYSPLCVPDQRNKAVHIDTILDFLEAEQKMDASKTAWAEIKPFVVAGK